MLISDGAKPYQHLYDRCDRLDRTLTNSELTIVNGAYPEKVKRFFDHFKSLEEEIVNGDGSNGERQAFWIQGKKRDDSYFTPSIEDVRVGYECERIKPDFSRNFDLFLPEGATKEDYNKAWAEFYCKDKFESEPYIITREDLVEIYQFPENGSLREDKGHPISGWYRTPYLTKEQIEAEGWKASGHFDKVFMRYDEKWCFGLWLLKDNKIHISKSQSEKETHLLYEGECKDINTFRYICKLLGI